MGLDLEGDGHIELPLRATKNPHKPDLVAADKVAVGHALGLAGLAWAPAWVELRKEMGLCAQRDGCLVPAIMPDGSFAKRRLRSGELLAWMASYLKRVRALRPGQRLGSHSGKATLLSWAAKYGVDKSTRRDLGYHIARKNRSVHAYSRDYQTAPLRRLAVVLKAVDEKEFDPDCTRSGRFKRKQPEEDVESEKPDESPEGEWIIAKLYAKLHKRREGSNKSCCGRATVGAPCF